MDLNRILDGTPEPPILDPYIESHLAQANTCGEYYLLTPLTDYQQELTDQIVSLHYSAILKYFKLQFSDDPLLVDSLKVMYLNTQLMATHPYLLVDHLMPKSLLAKETASRVISNSGKFSVFSDISKMISKLPFNIAVISREGRTMDLIEASLLGKKVGIKRYHGTILKELTKIKEGACHFHLFPSKNPEHMPSRHVKFDLIIAFDITYDEKEEFVNVIRFSNREKSNPAPIIHLVSFDSVEHVVLNSPSIKGKDHNDRTFLKNVTAATVVLRDRVGNIPPELRPIYTQELSYLKEWLSTCSGPWPLPKIPDIREYTSKDVEESLLSEVRHEAASPSLDEKQPTFYETKRLERDYSSNPLKQDTSMLTGISVITQKSYQTILTHQLVQAYTDTFRLALLLKRTIESYDEYEDLRIKDIEMTKKAMSKVLNDVMSAEAKLAAEISKFEKKKAEIIRMEDEMEEMEKEIKSFSIDIDNLDETHKMWLDNDREIDNLEQQLSGLEEKLTTRKSERNYTKTEVEHVQKLITESELETTKLNNEISDMENEYQKHVSYVKSLNWDEESAKFDEELKISRQEVTKLQQQLEDQLQRLSQTPKPRSRFTGRLSYERPRTNSPNVGVRSRGQSPAVSNSHPLQNVTISRW